MIGMNILLKMYSFFVLGCDIVYLIFGCAWAIIESLFKVIKPPKEKSVKGEVALVVGTARGVGRELALQLAALGAQVVCWDINSDGNQTTVKEAQDQNFLIHGYTCDVSNREDVLKTAQLVKRDVGDVTMLFHCCGVPSPRSLIAQPPPGIQETIDVSIMSHFWMLEAFLPRMVELNRGHIVALTSVAGLTGIKDQVPLCASQFAVQGMIEALSEELRANKTSKGIHLTIVHIFPFMKSSEASDLRLRIPSYFGTIEPKEAAKQIILGVRRNYMELSIPKHMMYIGHVVKILPRKASVLFRELLDTGVDFC